MRGCAPSVGPDELATSMAYPTGDPATSALMVTQVTPRSVRAGQAYRHRIVACNLSRAALQNVVVSQESVSNLRMTDSTPAGTRTSAGGMQWALGDLGPGESKEIVFSATAPEVGKASTCVSASYNNTLCSTIQVVQPALAITKTGPSEVLTCDTINYVIEVKNTGSGPAENVMVRETLPTGLTTTDGKNSVEFNAGTLAQGESRKFNVAARASKTGRYENVAEAMASGNLSAKSQPVVTVVKQPVLAIAVKCADRVYVGRDVSYEVTVRNTGDAEAKNVTVSSSLPTGCTFVRATESGALQGANVMWNIGSLAPGASRVGVVTIKAGAATSIRATATAQGLCAPPVSGECSTSVVGIPAILLECIDIDDPIEVGAIDTYVITVTNQGSAPDSNIRIVCELPAQQDFVSASGATAGSASGKTVTFAPLPNLAPRAKAEYRVVIKANAEGDTRFRVRLTSDQFKSPIEETESTNVYK
jgi:uncharacterized repeat protein (TIGR01451 family)